MMRHSESFSTNELIEKPWPCSWSRITLGCWAFGGGALWGEQSEKESVAVIHAAIDHGVNLLDTAVAYGGGESERVVGVALDRKRDQVNIATKAPPGVTSRTQLIKACESSLVRLKTDYIDLYQIHWPLRGMEFADIVETMRDLERAGKIRFAGVCNYGIMDMEDQLSAGGGLVSNQLPYSLLSRAIEFEILPKCTEEGVAVLAYSPLMQGLLTGKFRSPSDVPDERARSRHFSGHRPFARHGGEGFEACTFEAISGIREIAVEWGKSMEEVALAWSLRGEMVSSVIVGARTVEQLKQNIGASDLEMPETVYAQLNKCTETLKEGLGPNPDLWERESRYR